MTDHNSIVDLPPEPRRHPAEPSLARFAWVLIAGVTLVAISELVHPVIAGQRNMASWILGLLLLAMAFAAICPKLVRIAKSGTVHCAAPMPWLWTDGSCAAMVTGVNSRFDFVLYGEYGFLLERDTNHLFCASHRDDIGRFRIDRASDNTVKVKLEPFGRPPIDMVLHQAR